MDGPAASGDGGSGSWQVGSAYVSVSCDLTPAKQQLADLRSELQSITQGGYSVPTGLAPSAGTVAPMATPSAIASGQSGFAGVGGTLGVQQIHIDTSAAQRAVSDLKERVSELHAALATLNGNVGNYGGNTPNAVASAINSLPYQQTMTAAAGMGLGNFMSPSGVQFGHVMPSVTQAGHVAPTMTAGNIVNNAMGYQTGIMQQAVIQQAPFESFALEEEAAMVAGAGGLARGAGGRRGLSAWMNPLSMRGMAALTQSGLAVYGGFAALGFAGQIATSVIEGPRLERQYTREMDRLGSMVNPGEVAGAYIKNRAQLQREEDFIGAFENLPLIGSAISEMDIMKPYRAERMANVERQASMAVALPEMQLSSHIATARAAGNTVRGAQLEARKANLAAAEDERRAREMFGHDSPAFDEARDIAHQVYAAGQYTVARAEGQLAALPYEVDARTRLLTHDFGAQVRSLELEAKGMAIRQGKEIAPLEETVQRTQGKLFHTRTRGADNKYYDVYTGEGRDIAAFNDARADLDRARQTQKLEREEIEARGSDQRFRASNIADMAVAGVRSLNAAAGNDSYRASMIQFEAQSEMARKAAGEAGVNLTPTINAERQIRVARHQFDLQVAREGYDARTTAADEQSLLRPINAEATIEVERARHEVAMSSPELRGQVVETNRHELEARRKLLTAQRGGLVTQDMSMHEALGLMSNRGVDLTGRMIDIQHAGQTYKQGLANLANAPQAPQMNDGQLVQLVSQILKWLTTQKSVSGTWPAK